MGLGGSKARASTTFHAGVGGEKNEIIKERQRRKRKLKRQLGEPFINGAL